MHFLCGLGTSLVQVISILFSKREPSLLEARLKGFVWEFIVRSIKQLKCTETAIKVCIAHKELCVVFLQFLALSMPF